MSWDMGTFQLLFLKLHRLLIEVKLLRLLKLEVSQRISAEARKHPALKQDSLVSLLCHFGGNLDRNLLDSLQVWVQPTHSKVLLRIDHYIYLTLEFK